jgi:hypothetical protein
MTGHSELVGNVYHPHLFATALLFVVVCPLLIHMLCQEEKETRSRSLEGRGFVQHSCTGPREKGPECIAG